MQQRRIPAGLVELVLEFGAERRTKGGWSYSMDHAGIRRMKEHFGGHAVKAGKKLRRLFVVVSDEGEIITAAYRD